MIKSMTGFGRGSAQELGKNILIEIKSVNHRYCDIYTRIPKQLSFLEGRVKEFINKGIFRGKLDVFVTFDNVSEDNISILLDERLASLYLNKLEQLRDKFDLKDDISVSLLSGIQDVLKLEKLEQDEKILEKVFINALEMATKDLIAMREREGNGLRESLLQKTKHIQVLLSKIKEKAYCVVDVYRQRLESRIKEITQSELIDEQRLMLEIAIFADRCSIDEEVVRFDSHIDQFVESLNANEPVGRKLEFIIQEINREVNTIGSKANDLDISKNVVEIKCELEKIREQIQNIE